MPIPVPRFADFLNEYSAKEWRDHPRIKRFKIAIIDREDFRPPPRMGERVKVDDQYYYAVSVERADRAEDHWWDYALTLRPH